MFTPDSVFSHVAGVDAVDGGLLIGGVILPFNETALVVWRRFDGLQSVASISRSIAEEYSLADGDAYLDVSRIAALLKGSGALLVEDRPAEPCAGIAVPRDDLSWALARWERGGPAPSLAGLGEAERPKLLSSARHDRVAGLFIGLVAECGLDLAEGEMSALIELHQQYAAVSQYLEARLLEVVSHFEREGIEYRVLKGLAHARLDYPRWEYRPFGDIDLLVRRSDLARSADVLLAAGARPYSSNPSARHDPSHTKAVTVVFDGSPRAEIDIHADLVSGPFGVWMDAERLFEQSRPLSISGVEVDALSVSDAFVHACYTALVANWSIKPIALLDILQLADQLPDPDRVWDLARSWHGGTVIAGACRVAAERFPLDRDLLEPWFEPPFPVGLAERLVARLDFAPGRRSSVREGLTAALQPGIKRKVGYSVALVRPADNAGERFGARAARAFRDLERR